MKKNTKKKLTAIILFYFVWKGAFIHSHNLKCPLAMITTIFDVASAYCLRIPMPSKRMGVPKWKQYGEAWKKCLTTEHNVLTQNSVYFPCWYDSSQDLTETSSQIHCTGPSEKHSPAARSDIFLAGVHWRQ